MCCPHAENDAPHPPHRGGRRRPRRRPRAHAQGALDPPRRRDVARALPRRAQHRARSGARLGPARRRLLRPAQGPARLLPGHARQRLRQQGELALVPAPGVRGGHRPQGRPHPRRDQPARPRRTDPVRDHQRGDQGAVPDRRRLRHRVVPHRPQGHAVVRRRVRSLPAPHRRHRQGARGADPAAWRPLAGLSGPAGRNEQPRLLQRLRGHGDLARRPHAVPDARGPAGRRRRQDDPALLHVRHRQAALREGLPRLPRRRPRATSCPT